MNLDRLGPTSKADDRHSVERDPLLGWAKIARSLFGPALVIPLSIWATNAGRSLDVPLVLVAALVVWLAAMSVTRLVRARTQAHLAGAQLGVLSFWLWQAMPSDWFSIPLLEVAAAIGGITVVALAAAQLRSFPWIPTVLATGLGVAAVSMAVTGWIGDTTGDALDDPSPPPQLAGVTGGTDLLVLVVDAYTSPAVLADRFGYDMTSAEDDLASLGFSVLDGATSNFSVTHLSVPSLLALEYRVEPGDDETPELARANRRLIAGDAGLMSWMAEAGYRVSKFESGWEEDRCGTVDVCVAPVWFDGVTWWLLAGRTPLRGFRPSHPYPTTALSVLERLPDVVMGASANQEPDLIVAHVLSPHAPLFLTADCANEYVEDLSGANVGAPNMSPAATATRSAAYVAQVACVNKRLVALAQAVAGTETIVLIVGDHGSDIEGQMLIPVADWTDAQVVERFSVFAAVRAPAACGEPPLSVTNLGRFVVGCAVGQQLPLLPDQYLASLFGSPTVDVTNRLAEIGP